MDRDEVTLRKFALGLLGTVAALLLIASLASLSNSDAWYIRAVDFGR